MKPYSCGLRGTGYGLRVAGYGFLLTTDFTDFFVLMEIVGLGIIWLDISAEWIGCEPRCGDPQSESGAGKRASHAANVPEDGAYTEAIYTSWVLR